MFVAYNLNIPFATNSPSSDQPLMEANTNAVNTLISQDHYSFNTATIGGLHKQLSLPTLGAEPTAPANTGATIGSVYTNTVTRSAVNSIELFYVSGGTGHPYQLTQAIDASYALNATNTNYTAPGTTLGGWTFLPGGMILQYGIITPTHLPGTTTVKFPVAFSANPYSIQITATVSSATGDQTAAVFAGSVSATQFLASTSSSGTVQQFYWMAIGI